MKNLGLITCTVSLRQKNLQCNKYQYSPKGSAKSLHEGEFESFTLELECELKAEGIYRVYSNGLLCEAYTEEGDYFDFDMNITETDRESDLFLFVKTKNGLEEVSLEYLRSEVNKSVKDPKDKKAIKKFLSEKYI